MLSKNSLLPSATRNLFEKRFLDFQKLFAKALLRHPEEITGIPGAPIILLQGAVADRWHEVP